MVQHTIWAIKTVLHLIEKFMFLLHQLLLFVVIYKVNTINPCYSNRNRL